MKKMEITLAGSEVNVCMDNFEGQELYEVYTVLTAHLIKTLKDPNQIYMIATVAINDALKMLKDQNLSTMTM